MRKEKITINKLLPTKTSWLINIRKKHKNMFLKQIIFLYFRIQSVQGFIFFEKLTKTLIFGSYLNLCVKYYIVINVINLCVLFVCT